MSKIFDFLPGIEVPIGQALSALASMWDVEPSEGAAAPSEFRASQMNLVLHFGMAATPESAREVFDTALRFAQRYPCRILVLCPRQGDDGADELSCKIFSECYIGKSRQEMSCCEAIVLGYPESQRIYLENQASVLLESDLPLYYWPSRIRSTLRLSDYHYFLEEAKRVIYDSAVENQELIEFEWPKKENVRDLAYARILPVRQSIGQFLSSYAPAALADGLKAVRLSCRKSLSAEGKALESWLKSTLAACAADSGSESPEFSLKTTDETGPSMAFTWEYESGDKSFGWSADFEERRAKFDANFGEGSSSVMLASRLLRPENAIGESLFF